MATYWASETAEFLDGLIATKMINLSVQSAGLSEKTWR